MELWQEICAAKIRHAHKFGQRLPPTPTERLCVVTCLDSRLSMHRILGLHEGQAQIIRNLGATVGENELAALRFGQRHQGLTNLVVLGHTDCLVPDAEGDNAVESQQVSNPRRSVEAACRHIGAAAGLRLEMLTGLLYDVVTGDIEVVRRYDTTAP